MHPQKFMKDNHLDLDTLPDFMKEPNPQVKFHSAFPPLSTKVRVRSVMERAGFDVYKPDKSNAFAKHAFEPPRRPPFRSQSQNNLLSGFEKPSATKNRNFTAYQGSVNSSPNLNQRSNISTNSPMSDPPGNPKLRKKRSIVDYTREKLNLHTNKPKQAVIPNVYDELSIANISIDPKVEPLQSEKSMVESFNNISNESVVYQQDMEDDMFKNSTNLLPRPVSQINGPRPFVDSDEEEEDADHFKHHSRGSSAPTTDTHELNGNFFDPNTSPEKSIHIASQDQPQIPAFTNEYESQVIPTIDVESDSPQVTPKLNGDSLESSRGLRLSHASANSMSSFDAKFMNQDNDDDNFSQNSYGGLRDIRATFKSADFDQYHSQVEPLQKDYDDGTRLSTLSTNDMKIYNLKSWENKHDFDMSMIQEDDHENSMNKTSIPDIILEDEIGHNRNSFDNLERDDEVVDPLALDQYHTPVGEFTNRFVEPNTQDDQEYKDVESFHHEVEINDETLESHHDDGASLLSKGFQKRTASTVSTPNMNHDYSDAPPVPQVNVIPIVPSLKFAPKEGINSIIDDLDKFGIRSEEEDMITPSPHFKGKSQELPFNDSGNTSGLSSASKMTHTPFSQESHTTTFEDSPEPKIVPHIGQEIQYPPGEGPCRKCSLEILASEKKIWSKDHQLTGQWHRKCFGCTTCGAKFNKGSSCYVFKNEPYCEEHFHELNGSLCKICNKGVEGECLQNDVNEAFHIHCLTCVICGLPVQGDYFLFRDEVMCEHDAKELMFQIEEAEKNSNNDDSVEKAEKMIKRRTRVLYL